MEYRMSRFIRKYFERYCRQYLPEEDPKQLTARAAVHFDRLMHRTPDMGKKGNMMASNIDLTAAFLAYYEASDRRIDGSAIDVLLDWLAEDYRWVGFFTDMNRRRYIRPLYYRIYSNHAKKVAQHKAKGEWTGTWSFRINPEQRTEGIRYDMIGCPLYAFAKMHGYEALMPDICKFDFIFERFLHAKLIRTKTEATGGDCCDYWFVPDQSPTARQYSTDRTHR